MKSSVPSILILCSSWGSDGVHWFENDGNLNFTEHTIADFAKSTCVFVIDMDDDADLDVLGTNYGNGKIYFWENDGNQHFTEHPFSFTSAHWVRAIDLDNDQDMDMVGSSCGSTVAWRENDLQAGVYCCKLTNGNMSVVSRIVCVKLRLYMFNKKIS